MDNKEFDNMSNVDFYNKFINTKRLEEVSELTIKNYRIHLNKFFKYVNKDIRTMTTDDIRDYVSYHQKQTNCCNVSLDNIRRLLSGFFGFLELEDYIVKNPVRRIHKIRMEKLIKETYSDELMEQLRNNCTNTRNLAIIDLLSSSGMRIGELIGLNKTDINFESNQKIEDHAEELINIVSYISEISKQEHIVGKQLWLPNIAEEIYLDDVKKKYNWKPPKFSLETAIGQYDNPAKQ